MDNKEIRRRNLLSLIDEEIASSGRKAGARRRVAERADTEAAYISQLLSDQTKANIGDDFARRLEKAFGKEHGWMDTIGHIDPQRSATNRDPKVPVDPVERWPFRVPYPRFDALPEEKKSYIEGIIEGVIVSWEADRKSQDVGKKGKKDGERKAG